MARRIPLIVDMVVGAHTRNDASNTVRQHHDVQAIIVHEDYDDWNLYNDIALVKVLLLLILLLFLLLLCLLLFLLVLLI